MGNRRPHAARQLPSWLIFDVRQMKRFAWSKIVGGCVFADFDIDDEDRIFLRRISFDGYGCCHGDFKKMSLDDSRVLLGATDQGAIDDPEVERVLRTYFRENSDVIWNDALTTHELL